MLADYAYSFFTDVSVTKKQLQGLVLMCVDRIYRYAAEIRVKDAAVRQYFGMVTRYLLDIAAARGVRIFYILDNEIPQDRFDVTLELMFLSGVWVVTPYATNGSPLQVADVRGALDQELLAGRHVAYIEKDASVDYLAMVVDLARATDRYVIFRNKAPTSPMVEVLGNSPRT
jgi:hypothetical protein